MKELKSLKIQRLTHAEVEQMASEYLAKQLGIELKSLSKPIAKKPKSQTARK